MIFLFCLFLYFPSARLPAISPRHQALWWSAPCVLMSGVFGRVVSNTSSLAVFFQRAMKPWTQWMVSSVFLPMHGQTCSHCAARTLPRRLDVFLLVPGNKMFSIEILVFFCKGVPWDLFFQSGVITTRFISECGSAVDSGVSKCENEKYICAFFLSSCSWESAQEEHLLCAFRLGPFEIPFTMRKKQKRNL